VSSFWQIGALLCLLLASVQSQLVAPAKVDNQNITATAGNPTNITCRSYGNPISLCIWERFSPDKTRTSSTMVSYTEGADNSTASLPGYFLHGDLKSGECGIHKPNISRLDTSSWQCTLFTEDQVYRGSMHVDVVNKPDPPRFTPSKLDDLIDGETVGQGGSTLTCYSSYGLPPPTFKFFLDDEPFEGDLFPVNTTEDANGDTYTYQQLRNQHFTWRENGKKLRCVIVHDMITESDIKEASIPIIIKYKPRSEQNTATLYVPFLGKEQTNLSYTFYANPKPRIFWEIDGVGISAGFSTDDRRMEALGLEDLGLGKWQATLRVRKIDRADIRRRFILKTENTIGKQDFEICLTQNPSRQGLKCSNTPLFLQVPSPRPPVISGPHGDEEEEPEDADDHDDFRSAYESGNHREYSLKEKLRLVQRQMQSLRDQESRLRVQLQRLKRPKSLEAQSEDVVVSDSSSVQTPSSPSFVIGAAGPEHSEVKVESAGIYIKRKPGTSNSQSS